MRILVNVCNLEALDDHKISPLFLAAQYGQQECLEILVNAGKQMFFFVPSFIHVLMAGRINLFQFNVGQRLPLPLLIAPLLYSSEIKYTMT